MNQFQSKFKIIEIQIDFKILAIRKFILHIFYLLALFRHTLLMLIDTNAYGIFYMLLYVHIQ